MDGPLETPENRELQKKLAVLETENLRLSERVASLEERADSTHKHFVQLAKQVGRLIDQTGTMDLQVIELAEKVFPGYINTQRQIMDFCNPAKRDGEDKTSPA